MSRRAWVEQIMGMPISIHMRGGSVDSALVKEAVAECFESLREADATFSTYRIDSDVSRIRAGELSVDDADPTVRAVARLCRTATTRTAGAFTAQLPGGFDPSGIVKGWAVERAATILDSVPGHTFCINAGGDIAVGGDLSAATPAEDRQPWQVGIEDPHQSTPARIAHTVALARGGLATSGAAARGAHIWDPTTSEYVARPGSVTVYGPGLKWADVWATALYLRPTELDEAFATHAPEYHVVRL